MPMPAVSVVRTTRHRRTRVFGAAAHPPLAPALNVFELSLAAKHHAPPFPEACAQLPRVSLATQQPQRRPLTITRPSRTPTRRSSMSSMPDSDGWASDDGRRAIAVPEGRGSGKAKLAEAAKAAKAARRAARRAALAARYAAHGVFLEPPWDEPAPELVPDASSDPELSEYDNDWDDPMDMAHDLELELELEARTEQKSCSSGPSKSPSVHPPSSRGLHVQPRASFLAWSSLTSLGPASHPQSLTNRPSNGSRLPQTSVQPAKTTAPIRTPPQSANNHHAHPSTVLPPEKLLSRKPGEPAGPVICSPSQAAPVVRPSIDQSGPTKSKPYMWTRPGPPLQPVDAHRTRPIITAYASSNRVSTAPALTPQTRTTSCRSEMRDGRALTVSVCQALSAVWGVLTGPATSTLGGQAPAQQGTIPWRAWLTKSMGTLQPREVPGESWQWPLPLPVLGQWNWTHPYASEDKVARVQ